MPSLPLAARVVEVIADWGEGCSPRYRCASGCLVAGRTVLTAAHVVGGAVNVVVRGPDKIVRQAALDARFIGDVDGPGPDLALIEIVASTAGVPAMGLAAVDRDSMAGNPVERCHVIGYPVFKERSTADGGRFRETVDAVGQVPVLSGLTAGLLSVQVSSTPLSLPPAQVALGDSPWSGMSGAPVVADGCLLGVVTEHAAREGPSAITATPLTALEADPAHPGWGPGVMDSGAWWARLGVSDAGALKRLPAPLRGGRPAYWATVAEIRQRTEMLTGRQDELAELASFAGGDEGYRWLVGDAWAGKTSLLAEAVTTLPVDVVCYFLSRREADADSSRFLAAVIPQLASLLEEEPPAAELHQFRALWQRAVERARAAGSPLLLVVDGLDEDLRPPGLPSVAAQLPARSGDHVHVLVSSRPYPELPVDVPAGHPLRQVRPVLVKPYSGAQERAVLARQELDDLLRRDDDGLAADVLGLLTAAAGPLAVQDLAAMTVVAPQSAALARQIRRLLTTPAARSMQTAGLPGGDRYQFAHESLLAYAQADDDLNDPDFRRRVHQWAQRWRAAGWPTAAHGEQSTPQYLLDTYPSTLARDPQRLAQLTSDPGWIEAAIASTGVDRVLTDLRRAVAANPASTVVAAVLEAVTGQALNLRFPQPVDQPGYILRQLWMQSAELADHDLADDIRERLESPRGPALVPEWTTRRASRALSADLGRHDGWVAAVAVLADGRVVSGGDDGRVLVWDPAHLGVGPAELGRHDSRVAAVAVLADGRVVSGGDDGRVLVWDPAHLGVGPAELGRHDSRVSAVAVLADGRVVSGGDDGRVLVWDPAHLGVGPAELGRHDGWVAAVAVLADGRVVSGGDDKRVLVWDPAHLGVGPAELGRHDSRELGRDDSRVRAVAGLADGRVVSGGDDGRVLVWDPAHPGVGPAELGNLDGWLLAVAVLADGRVVTGGDDGRVLVWDPAHLGVGPAELGRHDSRVSAVAVLADGRVVTGGSDRRVLVWDPAHLGVGPAELGRHSWVTAVAVLADGRVVTGGNDRQVLVWDMAGPVAAPVELGRHDSWVAAVAGLADGRVVTGGNDGRVLVWETAGPVAGPAELGHQSWIRAVAGLADGRVVTGGNDGRVLVWDPAHLEAGPAELGHHSRVTAVAGLADGRVVTGGNDGRVLVWDPAHLEAGPAELGHHSRVTAVAVLADGRVVTGGNDGRVLVWDPAHLEAGPAELSRHHRRVTAVAVLADGRVVSGGNDGRVLVCNPAGAGSQVVQLTCSVTALATAPPGPARSNLAIVHQGSGFSLWSFAG